MTLIHTLRNTYDHYPDYVVKVSTWFSRVPLVTVVVGALATLIWLLNGMVLDLWGFLSLNPAIMSFAAMYRVHTYPLAHLGFFHLLMNLVAVTPLLVRFERENGSLGAIVLLFGLLAPFSAFLYLFITLFALPFLSASVGGMSIFFFSLMAAEAIRNHQIQPVTSLWSDVRIPTWATPLPLLVLIWLLVPSSSFIGHLCGLAVGYAYGARLLRLAEPPEWVLYKIESLIPAIKKLPAYISLDYREKTEAWGRGSTLPTVNVGGPPPPGFSGPGRALGV